MKNKVKEVIKGRGLMMSAVAEKAQMSESWISRVCNGQKCTPTMKYAISKAIEDLTGRPVAIEELFPETESAT